MRTEVKKILDGRANLHFSRGVIYGVEAGSGRLVMMILAGRCGRPPGVAAVGGLLEGQGSFVSLGRDGRFIGRPRGFGARRWWRLAQCQVASMRKPGLAGAAGDAGGGVQNPVAECGDLAEGQSGMVGEAGQFDPGDQIGCGQDDFKPGRVGVEGIEWQVA